MAHVDVLADDVSLSDPTLVEGLPGAGLVGKIATDHLIEEFEMAQFANVHCDALPPVATYDDHDPSLRPPVRLYVDADRDLLALRSDVPVSTDAATQFADCLSDLYDRRDVTPIYVSGLPSEKEDAPPSLHGVAAGGAADRLDAVGIDAPGERGLITGPTGALLGDAVERDRPALGLIVETDPRFPDPEAANALVRKGLEPLTGLSVPVDSLVDRAEEIRDAKEQLAQRVHDAEMEQSTQARPLRMYH
jgi:uncharacterized protein